MTDAEFREWFSAEVASGSMTQEQQDDLLEQKQYFDLHRTDIERLHQHQVVGYVAGSQKIASSVQELLITVQQTHPGRRVYFEPVGFELV